ncbi:MAG: hypothetical protein V4550_01085 [Gemmatimonadota bacterium]
MPPTRYGRVAVVAFAVLAIACGDITRAKATYTSVLGSFALYTLTNSPPAVPNALLFLGGQTRATSTFSFDVAFDLDADGKPVIYPVATLAGAPAGTQKRIGLQIIPVTFNDLREVPATGYDTVSAKSVPVGATVAVEMRDPAACYSSNIYSITSQFVYAKMVIDSVNLSTRRLFLRTVIDPNCGYRMVVPDSVPTN